MERENKISEPNSNGKNNKTNVREINNTGINWASRKIKILSKRKKLCTEKGTRKKKNKQIYSRTNKEKIKHDAQRTKIILLKSK